MKATLATHLAISQNGMNLYGFSDVADRDFFEKLLSVSGIGPKTALGILRRSPREGLERAIARRDITYLTRVAGLGKKSAEKLAVELAEKMGDTKSGGSGDDAEVFDTLVALGYTEREARRAVSGIAEHIAGKEARLRAALSSGGSGMYGLVDVVVRFLKQIVPESVVRPLRPAYHASLAFLMALAYGFPLAG